MNPHFLFLPRRHAPQLLAVLLIVVAGPFQPRSVDAFQETPLWSVIVYEKGRKAAEGTVGKSDELHKEIEALRKKSVERSRADGRSFAPSLRIETDCERLDVGTSVVVYSQRKSKDAVWSQSSRGTDDDDARLRRKLIEFVRRSKSP